MTFVALIELADLLESLAAEPEAARVVLLTSATPGYFINHADLGDLERVGSGRATPAEQGSWPGALGLLESIPQPVIAAIDGLASGGGHELALAATLRVASDRARLQQPEVPIGIIPGGGGSVRLPRLIGPGRAAEVILTGREVTAAEAYRSGWVNQVFPAESFAAETLAYAQSIATASAAALSGAKKSIVLGSRMPFADAQTQERSLFSSLSIKLGPAPSHP